MEKVFLKTQRFIPSLIVLAAPLLLLWRLAFLGEVLYWGVPMTQFYPWHSLVNAAVQAGQLPLWTDLLGNGTPLIANLQTGFFYPPNVLFRLVPVERAMGYSDILHLMGAGLAALFWGRTLGLRRLGRITLALSYALGGYVVGRTQFITMVAAYAWLPLLLALTERLIATRRRYWTACLGLALGLQFLAGHAQTWFYSLCLLFLYAAYRLVGQALRNRSLREPAIALGMLAGAAGLGVGLAAVQILPTAELAVNSQRSSGAAWDFAMTYSFWPWRLLTIVAPNLFGSPALGNYSGYANYWEDTVYFGILPLLLAVVATVAWLKHGRRSDETALLPPNAMHVIPFFAALVPVAILLAMGKNTPLFPWVFTHVPGFGFFQAPSRLLLWVALAGSTLAGLGAQAFRLTYWTQYSLRLLAAGAAAMALISLAAGRLDIASIHVPAFTRLAVLLGGAAILLLLRGRDSGDADERVRGSPLPRPTWRAALVVFIGLDLLSFGMPLTPSLPAAVYHPEVARQTPDALRQGSARLYIDPQYEYAQEFKFYFLFDTFGTSQVDYWQQLRQSWLPNLNAVDGIPAVNNNDPLVIGWWKTTMETLETESCPARVRLLSLLNVGYILTDKPCPEFSPVGDSPNLYQAAGWLPRAWLVPEMEIAGGDQWLPAAVSRPGFDPTRTVLLPAAAGSHREAGAPTGNVGKVDSLREAWNSRTIRLAVSRPGFLVLAYTYYPGWQAVVDGQPRTVTQANYTLTALRVAPGDHEVVLTYRPWWLPVGLAISGFALVVLLVLALAPFRGARSERA